MSDEQWAMSRKVFVRSMLLAGVALQLPWLSACSPEESITINTSPLSHDAYRSLKALQNVLFPEDGNGPGAARINADRYFLYVINDPRTDPEIQTFLLDKLERFTTKCLNENGLNFFELRVDEAEHFVESVANEVWGQNWLSRQLNLIFEALLLDPRYDVNPAEIGWNWLEHDPGQPRPVDKNAYPQILLNHEV